MNEYVEIRFRRNNKPWRVRRQVPGGVELDEPDPLQRTVGIGFDGADDITKYRMRRIRQLQGWEPNQFKLAVAVEDGAIVLRGVTPLALPEGGIVSRLRSRSRRPVERRRPSRSRRTTMRRATSNSRRTIVRSRSTSRHVTPLSAVC